MVVNNNQGYRTLVENKLLRPASDDYYASVICTIASTRLSLFEPSLQRKP